MSLWKRAKPGSISRYAIALVSDRKTALWSFSEFNSQYADYPDQDSALCNPPVSADAMFDKFNQRSYELENIDKGTYTPEEYEGCLVELRRVNEWLGDARALEGTLFAELERAKRLSFSVLDVGAGSGELLRVTAKWARD